MKQAKKYIGISCAILISAVIIRNYACRMIICGLSYVAYMIIGYAEMIRFQDFIWKSYPSVYYEYKNYNGCKRGWLWEYAKEHSQKSVTNDPLLLENCRRCVICSNFAVAFIICLMIVMFACTVLR